MNTLAIFLSLMAIAIATVIFIHLFFKRVSKTVPFTYTWLLKKTLQQIKRRRRLQHLLILLLRTGTIALVTLALLSFFYKPQTTNIPAVVIIDNSASMTRDDPPLLWQAIKWVEDNVDNFLYAITCDNIIKDENQLANIETYYGFCSLDKQLALISNLRDSVATIVVSDFQTGYYTGLIKQSFIPVPMDGTVENAWIDSLWRMDNNLVVKWFNTGITDLSLQLKLNGNVKAVKKWHSNDSIQYDTILITPEGRINTIHISISGDPTYFDNDFYATIGTRPIKVFLKISDTTIHLARVIRKDTAFQIVPDIADADVLIAGYFDNLPESVRKSLLTNPNPKILFYKGFVPPFRVWLNRRNPFWKDVIQDYGKAPTPLSISAPCLQYSLPGTPLLFTDSCTIASVENQTVHVVYDADNPTFSSHPIYIAMIYKVLLGNRVYELDFLRNNEQTISRLANNQNIKIVPWTEKSSDISLTLPVKPGFYYLVSDRDTQLVGINLPKKESILEPKVPQTGIEAHTQDSRIMSFVPYLLLSFALILLLIESLVLRKRKDYEENTT
ncbi:MAG: hypothetical protein GXO48_01000 [Chlorobi bacterium]|nr:hypothetical protein [Chlorobiota bacterium]